MPPHRGPSYPLNPPPSPQPFHPLPFPRLPPTLAAAFITGGMMLTAAKFYGAPTMPNARLLFRASLLHLPIFMAAFLVHREPNLRGDKAALLRYNASLLGLSGHTSASEGELVRQQAAQQQQQQAGGSGSAGREAGDEQAVLAWTMRRISLPPLPFLPAPVLPGTPQVAAATTALRTRREGRDAPGPGAMA
jgi:hypothetical protein